ncbi:hypothetical protein BRY75_02905 [Acinetobacter baumannii]|uniref:hypothetical protein n=1 Tax=Acinetobacter baumannii TaxID=470 RepID=UPI000928E7ED|nr:hypothetical protein [Acinetobacter baumannii]OJK08875.1 hypothetical protein BRY75_02905 [Acinetobacter baumannii]
MEIKELIATERPLFEKNIHEVAAVIHDFVWHDLADGSGAYQPNWGVSVFDEEIGEDYAAINHAHYQTKLLMCWLECAKLKNAEIESLKAELAKAKEATL